jgi:hypothetical protein
MTYYLLKILLNNITRLILSRLNKQRNDQHDRNILLFTDNCPVNSAYGIKI